MVKPINTNEDRRVWNECQIENGGPAFPVLTTVKTNGEICGMQTGNRDGWEMGLSQRDYFAAKAMQGLIHDILIDQHCEDVLMKNGLKASELQDFLARLAYGTADAMLRARSVCQLCGGSGEADSGGFREDGQPISLPCECISAAKE